MKILWNVTGSHHLLTETNPLQDQSLNLCESQRADQEAKELHWKNLSAKEGQEAGKDQPAEGEDLEVLEDPEAETEEEPILDQEVDLVLQEDLLKTMMDADYMLQVYHTIFVIPS